MLPFRETGNDFIINLRDGKEKMDSETGREAAEFMKEMGQYFNDGFAATDYATAQSMFLDGKSAMYYTVSYTHLSPEKREVLCEIIYPGCGAFHYNRGKSGHFSG